jgi:protein-tyrosine kinase
LGARARKRIDLATLTRAGMVEGGRLGARVLEEFRVAQGQILRAAFAGGGGEQLADPVAANVIPANVVMVTSARAGEGKSFAALNLAASIARQRDRCVLLVDVDPKLDALGPALGLTGEPGLLDLAADPGLDPDQAVAETALANLAVLPLGQDLDRGDELFATRQMARLIRDLARRYPDRLIVLDAPPCLVSSHPSTLAPSVGQILLVIEAGTTQREEIEATIDLLQACPSITLLLNKVSLTTRNSFGAYAAAHSA